MAWIGVITNAGTELLSQWAGGGVLTITSAKTGAGTVQEALLMSQTDVTTQKQTASITGSTATQNYRKIKVQVAAHTESYTLKQIGVFAKINSGTEKLLAIYQNADGVSIPASATSPDFLYSFFANIAMSNSGNISITIDTESYVSVAELTAHETDATAHAALLATKQNSTQDLTEESALADADYVPFYDTSETANRKTLWSNIKAKLKTYFDTLYAAVSHTHSYAGSSSAGGAATSANKVNAAVTFNNGGSGVASGTTFDGSTARTVSYNTVGAAASSHTHTKSQITDFPTSMTPTAHTHGTGDITSGTLAVGRGGTGVTSNPSMLTNLGSTSAASVFASSPRPGVTGTLPVANGGTGSTTPETARSALGLGGAATRGVREAVITELITETGDWKVPAAKNQSFSIRIFGGGGGGGNSSVAGNGGGGGGHMSTWIGTLTEGNMIPIIIGEAGLPASNGGASSFGTYISASGGSAGFSYGGGGAGGAGGSGGGGCGGPGGSATYGGGGGGGGSINTSNNGCSGGNGGTYGGGGGGGGSYQNRTPGYGGSGGTYGGAGGNGSHNSTGGTGSNGTNTTSLNIDYKGTGVGGSGGYGITTYGGGGGGGGGYGGSGGSATFGGGGGGGGGGGYGAAGGSATYGSNGNGFGGGGGGYGGPGKNSTALGGGGGGGYGSLNVFAAGGDSVSSGTPGICIIQYTVTYVS